MVAALTLLLLAGCGDGGADQTGQGGTGSPASTASRPPVDPDTTSSSGPGDAAPTRTEAPGGTMADHGPGDILTQDDTGATVRLPPGAEATLQLSPPLDGAEPEVEGGDVVELVPVDHFADPGYAEFQLLAHAPGTAVVTVADPTGGDPVVLHVVVEDG